MANDCQSLSTLDERLRCAATLNIEVYTNPTESPPVVASSVLPTGLQANLEDCTGNDSCKLVSYDFQGDSGAILSKAEYVVNTKNNEAVDRGVFVKEGAKVPTVMREPPGFDFSSAIDPSRATQIGSASTGSSSEVCARVCEDDSTCKAFNYEPLSSRCEYFSSFTEESYGDPTFQKIGFVRQDIPITAGKKYPGVPDAPVTYLNNTGVDCEDMPKCNSNLEALVNSGTTVGFSTDDIDACGYCPLKTFRFKDNSYFVQGELGETKSFTDKAQALEAIKFKQVGPNPNTTISALQQNYIYTLNSYLQDVTSTTNDTFYNNTQDKTRARTMSEEADFNAVNFSFVFVGVNRDDLKTATQSFDWARVNTLIGPTFGNLVQKGVVAREVLIKYYFRDPAWISAYPQYQSQYDRDRILKMAILKTIDSVGSEASSFFGSTIWNKIKGSWRYVMNKDWNGLSGFLGTTEATLIQGSVISSDFLPRDVLYTDSRFYNIQVIGRKLVLGSLTQNLTPMPEDEPESSNTWEVETVDYVTNGIRIKNVESQKYVSATLTRDLYAWGDKYTDEFNKTIFIASNPVPLEDFLVNKFHSDHVMFQTPDGTKRTTWDGTVFKNLKNIFSIFKLTFDVNCAPRPPTICTPPSITQAPHRLKCPGNGTFRAGTNNSKCNGNANIRQTTNAGAISLCEFSCASGYDPVGGWSEGDVFGCGITKSCIADSYTEYSCPVGFTLEGQMCRPTADSGCSSSLTGSCSSQIPTLTTSGCTTERVNWVVVDVPNSFHFYGTTDDTVNINDPPTAYQALYDLSGSSNVYPSNSTKSLRRWVQEDYVYKNFAPGVIDASIAGLGTMYIDVKSWDEASTCIFRNVGTINTRYPNAVTDTGATERNLIGSGSNTLISKHSVSITELSSFYTSLTPWNNVENVKTLYNDSAAIRLLAIKNYLIFMKKAIDAFKLGMNKVMDDLLRYMSETTAINDAQLNQVNEAYMIIRDKKADIDTAVVSQDVTNIITNWTRITTTTSANATSAPLPSGWSAMSVQSQQYLGDVSLKGLIDETYTLLKSMKDLVTQNYNDYNDSYNKLQEIKGYSGTVEKTNLTVPIQKALDDKRISITTAYYEQLKIDTISPSLQIVRNEIKNQVDRIMSVGIIAACASGNFRALASDPVCTQCTSCAAGTYVSTDCTETTNRVCTPCTTGTNFSAFPNAGSCTDCTTCQAGTRVVTECTTTENRTCTTCLVGTYTITDNQTTCQTCATCAAGTRVDSECTTTSNRTCTVCAVGYYSTSANSSQCTQCVSGSTTSSTGSASCTCTGTLQNGYYEWSVANICTKKCNRGYTLSASGTCDLSDCVAAGGRQYNATVGGLSYADTAFGTVSRIDTVTDVTTSPCSSASPPSSVTLTLPDRSVSATTSTTSVSVGSSVTYTTARGAYCPAGTTYTTSCVACPAGTYSGTAGKSGTTAANCTSCASENYSYAGATSCSTCTAACTGSTYESTSCTATSNRVCTACTSCTSPSNGTASVTGCSGTSGPGSCSYSCNAGYFYDSSKSTPTCTQCSAGTYSAAGATSCTKCDAGKYSAAGASSCSSCSTTCGAGKYISSVCTTSSDIGCTQCSTSCYNPLYSQRASCSGTETSDPVCVCPAGSTVWNLLYGNRACVCSAGYYGSGGYAPCTACPSGQFSSDGSVSCTVCRGLCGAGTQQTSACTSTSDRVCTACPAGQYSAIPPPNQNAVCVGCDSCPIGQTRSGCGGSSAGTCVCNSGTVSEVVTAKSSRTGCYTLATYSVTSYTCPSPYYLGSKNTMCYANPFSACSRYTRSGCAAYVYYCPAGADLTISGNGCTTSGCCNAPSKPVYSWTCPAGTSFYVGLNGNNVCA